MDRLHAPKSEALRALFWRDEILQVMFWIQAEGFGNEVDPGLLERFLGVEADISIGYADRLVDEGMLSRNMQGSYRLTDAGASHGRRVFSEEFADLTKPGHGECGPECWCHNTIEEAEACAEERRAHHHPRND